MYRTLTSLEHVASALFLYYPALVSSYFAVAYEEAGDEDDAVIHLIL